MRRIDTHAHMVPGAYTAELSQRGLEPTPPHPSSSGEHLTASMDRREIDAAVVCLPPPGVWFEDEALARRLSRLVNEELASLVRSDPSRFAGLATLPLPIVDAALEEISYALDTLGLDGIALPSQVAGTYLGDPVFDPVVAELDRRGAYVYLHPVGPAAPTPLPHVPAWVQEFPFDTTRALVNLIYSGTLERSPRIRLQVPHLGGAAPFLAGRLAQWVEREPDRAELAPAGAVAYLRRLYYDTGLTNDPVALAAVRALAGIERVTFGSDWPFLTTPDGVDPMTALGLTGHELEAVACQNALALVPRLRS
ncbi:amidohydrolase family protein [Streptomyces mirabilis]|uniref:amidohydrolase family protein n=1 Tax=Streptomyces mirabilis TaxID=68239 RepID=UPI0033D6684C